MLFKFGILTILGIFNYSACLIIYFYIPGFLACNSDIYFDYQKFIFANNSFWENIGAMLFKKSISYIHCCGFIYSTQFDVASPLYARVPTMQVLREHDTKVSVPSVSMELGGKKLYCHHIIPNKVTLIAKVVCFNLN